MTKGPGSLDSGQRHRASQQEGLGVAYLRVREGLKSLQAQARTLARDAYEIYELMRQHGPNELAVANSLPHPELVLIQPITLTLMPIMGVRWRADLQELGLSSHAPEKDAAVRAVLRRLASTYLALEQRPSSDPEGWQIVQQLVRRPDAPQRAAPLQQDGGHQEATTLPAWLEGNAPTGAERGVVKAWQAGANARLRGGSHCRYKGPLYVTSWWNGYGAMSRYLDAGGLILCRMCHQPWSGDRSKA